MSLTEQRFPLGGNDGEGKFLTPLRTFGTVRRKTGDHVGDRFARFACPHHNDSKSEQSVWIWD